jgi:hypothetical protein
MIHIITYQSIKGNDEQKIFEDFASALKLITSLQQNDYPFSYNSVDPDGVFETISDFMEGYRQYEKRDKKERIRFLGSISMDAFVATNNQTRFRVPVYSWGEGRRRLFDIKEVEADEAIEALELEQKISA